MSGLGDLAGVEVDSLEVTVKQTYENISRDTLSRVCRAYQEDMDAFGYTCEEFL